VKWVIRNIKRSDSRRILARVLRMDTAEEVEDYVQQQLVNAGLGKVVRSKKPSGRLPHRV
jgi:signal transduction protein with GAF and PtsI domain